MDNYSILVTIIFFIVALGYVLYIGRNSKEDLERISKKNEYIKVVEKLQNEKDNNHSHA